MQYLLIEIGLAVFLIGGGISLAYEGSTWLAMVWGIVGAIAIGFAVDIACDLRRR